MSNRAEAVQELGWSGMLEMYKGVGDSLFSDTKLSIIHCMQTNTGGYMYVYKEVLTVSTRKGHKHM